MIEQENRAPRDIAQMVAHGDARLFGIASLHRGQDTDMLAECLAHVLAWLRM